MCVKISHIATSSGSFKELLDFQGNLSKRKIDWGGSRKNFGLRESYGKGEKIEWLVCPHQMGFEPVCLKAEFPKSFPNLNLVSTIA